MNGLTFYCKGRYLYYSFYASDGRAVGSTGIVLSATETKDNLTRANNNKKNMLAAAVDRYVADCNLANIDTSKTAVETLILQETGKKPSARGMSMLELAQRFHEACKAGDILTRSKTKYSDSSLNLQRVIIGKLKTDKIGAIPVSKFTLSDFNGFVKRLANAHTYNNTENTKSSKNGYATYTNQLVSILEKTLAEGWHKNNLTALNELTDKGESIDYAIYYSIDELQRLYNHKFTGFLEQLRDVFIFGCFTCLRHSDYYRTNYKNAVVGNELIVELKKKKNRVTVPLHHIAIEILEKYDYTLPKIGMHDFNHYKRGIRKVCKEAGFNQLVLFTRTEGMQRAERYKEKWELTTSHTMRRSFATNALKLGMKEWVIMAIGGWKSEASFKKYKRMSEQDVKDNAMASEFYRVVLG